MELTHAGKKGLCVKTSMIYRMILDKSGARRCQIWVKTPEAAQVTSLGGESRRCCCCCCTNRSTFLCEVAFKFLYLYDFTRDKLLLRMLEQTNEFSWYEFVIRNSLFVAIVDFVKTIWLDIEFAKAKFVCCCGIPWTTCFFHSDQDWKYKHMSRNKSSATSKRLFPVVCWLDLPHLSPKSKDVSLETRKNSPYRRKKRRAVSYWIHISILPNKQ